MGIKCKGSKLDMLLEIKRAISKDNEKFKKAFSKLWGCSGGWVSGTCPHGVIYALKFDSRAESPRDYVGILLSFKHQPNITVVDMPNLVVAHSSSRKKFMFTPYDGMVTEATENNIHAAVNNTLHISLPWLYETKIMHLLRIHLINMFIL